MHARTQRQRQSTTGRIPAEHGRQLHILTALNKGLGSANQRMSLISFGMGFKPTLQSHRVKHPVPIHTHTPAWQHSAWQRSCHACGTAALQQNDSKAHHIAAVNTCLQVKCADASHVHSMCKLQLIQGLAATVSHPSSSQM